MDPMSSEGGKGGSKGSKEGLLMRFGREDVGEGLEDNEGMRWTLSEMRNRFSRG